MASMALSMVALYDAWSLYGNAACDVCDASWRVACGIVCFIKRRRPFRAAFRRDIRPSKPVRINRRGRDDGHRLQRNAAARGNEAQPLAGQMSAVQLQFALIWLAENARRSICHPAAP